MLSSLTTRAQHTGQSLHTVLPVNRVRPPGDAPTVQMWREFEGRLAGFADPESVDVHDGLAEVEAGGRVGLRVDGPLGEQGPLHGQDVGVLAGQDLGRGESRKCVVGI